MSDENHDTYKPITEPPLTRREHFAAMAMQGLISNPALFDSFKDDCLKLAANQAGFLADAAIAELERTKE